MLIAKPIKGFCFTHRSVKQNFELAAPRYCSVPHLVGFNHCLAQSFHQEVSLLILLPALMDMALSL